MKRSPEFHLCRPEFSYGEFFSGSHNFLSIIWHLCILAFKGIGSQRSLISLYVRIIAHSGGVCVVIWETTEDFEKAIPLSWMKLRRSRAWVVGASLSSAAPRPRQDPIDDNQRRRLHCRSRSVQGVSNRRGDCRGRPASSLLYVPGYPPMAASTLFSASAMSRACSTVMFMLKSNRRLRPRMSRV